MINKKKINSSLVLHIFNNINKSVNLYHFNNEDCILHMH